MWHYFEAGSGRPLVLLHGIGMSHKAWSPVIPALSAQRRIIAFDTAGFGSSPPLPKNIPPTTVNLVKALGEVLKEMGIHEPIDIAGNSMGGYMALEAAKQGLARSVVAISPAGLWHAPPAHVKHLFFSMRRATQLFPSLVSTLLKTPLFRELFMAVPISAGSWRMPAEDAISAALDFANASGFEDTFAHAEALFGAEQIAIPLTVAFGTKDWLLTRRAQLRSKLPAHTRWLQPTGWGHVPMWQDPAGVTQLILEGTR